MYTLNNICKCIYEYTSKNLFAHHPNNRLCMYIYINMAAMAENFKIQPRVDG